MGFLYGQSIGCQMYDFKKKIEFRLKIINVVTEKHHWPDPEPYRVNNKKQATGKQKNILLN